MVQLCLKSPTTLTLEHASLDLIFPPYPASPSAALHVIEQLTKEALDAFKGDDKLVPSDTLNSNYEASTREHYHTSSECDHTSTIPWHVLNCTTISMIRKSVKATLNVFLSV